MQIVTCDFETYYDKDYSLSKLTTEEYIRDPRFEVIMLGIRWPDGTHEVVTGTHAEIQYRLDGVDWSQYAILAHNTLFDGAILAWIFGVKPAAWLDTYSMARAMFGGAGNSLAALAKRYNLEEKGTYVANMMGRRRESLSPAEFKLYAEYCIHDVELCYTLFHHMSNGWYSFDPWDNRGPYPIRELELIDRLLRMYTEPVLRLNKDMLQEHYDEVIARKKALLDACTAEKDTLMSNQKFAELLESFGVTPPMKISATTKKWAFAFAKTDPGMKDLLEHPDERVQAVVAARMGVKSTLEETRTLRFMGIAERFESFAIPLRYSAARTHRLGGADKINMQNLPARGAAGGKLKACIEPPPDHIIIDCDSSNIEARMLAWLAQQEDLVTDFANNVDVYCKMATRIYNRDVTKADKLERFVGKTVVLGCLSEETMVLCERGWTLITNITLEDRVWDGLTWVNHQGLLHKGLKQTLNLCGLWLTPDHRVLCGKDWKDAQSVQRSEKYRYQALGTGAENLPSQATLRVEIGGYQRLLYSAGVADQNIQYTLATSGTSKAHDVTYALSTKLRQITANFIGHTQTVCQKMSIGRDYSIDYLRRYQDATTSQIGSTLRMEGEAYLFVKNGAIAAPHSSGMRVRCRDGMYPTTKWTGLITTKGTNQETSSLYLEAITSKIAGVCQHYKQKLSSYRRNLQTYDLLMAGPNNRFTVLTDKGPMIVHNCGYQTGKMKLQATLKAADPPMILDEFECDRIVQTYRSTYYMIPRLWKQASLAIQAMHDDKFMWLGKEGVLAVEGKKGIKLPNGLYLQYPQLHRQKDKDTGEEKWVYKDVKGFVSLYGGKLVENVVQALARIVVTQQLLKIAKRYRVVLTVHDAVACVVKVSDRANAIKYNEAKGIWVANCDEVREAQAFIEEVMRWVPKWAAGCPINCESGIGNNYGEC